MMSFSRICSRNGAQDEKEGRNKRISRTTFNQLSDHRLQKWSSERRSLLLSDYGATDGCLI
jgi:hypothetical protein